MKKATMESINTDRAARRFSKAASAYVVKATASKKAARQKLVSLGIYTEKGNLKKNYKR
jgi:hypothetical protein